MQEENKESLWKKMKINTAYYFMCTLVVLCGLSIIVSMLVIPMVNTWKQDKPATVTPIVQTVLQNSAMTSVATCSTTNWPNLTGHREWNVLILYRMDTNGNSFPLFDSQSSEDSKSLTSVRTAILSSAPTSGGCKCLPNSITFASGYFDRNTHIAYSSIEKIPSGNYANVNVIELPIKAIVTYSEGDRPIGILPQLENK